MYFDTHAHLDQEEFDADRDEVITRAQAAGVADIIAMGVTANSSTNCVKLARQYNGIHAAVGIQPNYVHEAAPSDWDTIVRLVSQPGVVALGETGLDRYWDFAPFDLQQDYFDRHIRFSQETNLPFIVHMRECEDDIMQMLREAAQRGPLKGVMHSFTGEADMAAECVELGMHISFAGMVTFKKSDELRAVSATVPLDRLLIETDAPYLSPEPVRKIRRNEPAHVIHTCACLAQVRSLPVEEVAAATTANARRLFQVD
ncbi:TatD family hydrolase [Aeoliella sp. ICT_H6.2]|uniref:TatD family hydrolase n=1 Tax=Aeoliella straminimaris TaxID=2954799 RepID=A0A9X2F973_9BACT|nr:TatD family hydrolase [Aeoliella straminimaris]MCO6044199.1 TatD family hydrolase [Aeoliella straminimaris]